MSIESSTALEAAHSALLTPLGSPKPLEAFSFFKNINLGASPIADRTRHSLPGY